MKKRKDLTIILFIYLLAYATGYILCYRIQSTMLKMFVFDVVATCVTFLFSTIYSNSSVYDAYWSLTPMVMSIWLFVAQKSVGVLEIFFLIIFNIWGIRLTLNWIQVFTDFSYEDWRYKKYRDSSPRFLWPLVNFWGIHMMPTLIVFGGMLPLFDISQKTIGPISIIGMGTMLFGISLEFFADRQMHKHLNQDNTKSVCQIGLWKYSRHPNYLGEISFWLGVYLVMLPYSIQHWYYGGGCLAIALLFNCISIPLMEKRQLQKRIDYAQYCQKTSRLLLKKSGQ